MNSECLFCKIVAGKIATKFFWENDIAVAFADIHPKAPVHMLVVPKQHIKNLDALDNEQLAGQLVMAIREVIKQLGLVEANQVLIQGIDLDHLHFHVMSDERYHGPAVL